MSGLGSLFGRLFGKKKETAPPPVEPKPTPTPVPRPTLPQGLDSTVYFGRLAHFGGAKTLGEAIEKMAEYELIVFPGDCVLMGPSGWQHDDAITCIQELKGITQIAGYVPLGTATGEGNMGEDGKLHRRISRDEFKRQCKTWRSMGVEYIFADMFGNTDEYEVTIADQIFAIECAHELMIPIIMNAWRVADVTGHELPVWPGRDMMMFEDMGSSPIRDAAKWREWNLTNKKNLLVIGVAFEKYKGRETDQLFKQLAYGGYAPEDYGG